MSADDLIARELEAEITRLRVAGSRMASLLEQKEVRIAELEWNAQQSANQEKEIRELRMENEKLKAELAKSQELATYVRRAYEARARESEGGLASFQNALAAREPAKAAPAPAPQPPKPSKSEIDRICETYELKLSKLRTKKDESERQLQATQVICARQETEVQWLRNEFRRLSHVIQQAHAATGAWQAEARRLQAQLNRAHHGVQAAAPAAAIPAVTAPAAAPAAPAPLTVSPVIDAVPLSPEIKAAFNELAALQGELEQERLRSDEARRAISGQRQPTDA